MGRALTFVYGLFALAATCRATVQIVTKFDQAPIAYVLSAVAGLIYIAATVGLARGNRALALTCCSIELAGVIAIGIVSLIHPSWFPDASVWSGFGQGYGYIPLVLPILGLLYLRHTRPSPASSTTTA